MIAIQRVFRGYRSRKSLGLLKSRRKKQKQHGNSGNSTGTGSSHWTHGIGVSHQKQSNRPPGLSNVSMGKWGMVILFIILHCIVIRHYGVGLFS